MVHSVHRAWRYNSDTMASRSRRWKQKEERVTYLESEMRIYEVRKVVYWTQKTGWYTSWHQEQDNKQCEVHRYYKSVRHLLFVRKIFALWEMQEGFTVYPQATALFARWEHPVGSRWWRFLPGEDLGTYKTVTASLQGPHIHPWSRNGDLPHGRSMALTAGS